MLCADVISRLDLFAVVSLLSGNIVNCCLIRTTSNFEKSMCNNIIILYCKNIISEASRTTNLDADLAIETPFLNSHYHACQMNNYRLGNTFKSTFMMVLGCGSL